MADVNSKDGCSSCIYFLSTGNDFIGTCRRYPTYQNRHGSEWCGEFVIVPPNPVFEAMIQDIEIAVETAKEAEIVETSKEKRKKVLEEAAKVEPKPKGRPKKVAK
jgi:hypothetical protein